MLKLYINLIDGSKIELNIPKNDIAINIRVDKLFNNGFIDNKFKDSFNTKNALIRFDGVDKNLSKEILKSALKLEAKMI